MSAPPPVRSNDKLSDSRSVCLVGAENAILRGLGRQELT
ncbi:uncharacterized protein METZ01_LOCUS140219 [marine metagenome]|uniref:Uncharacterized protein n=1 Tax=marine metagenome TaxID=408172 RepID=A0A381ZDJ4_9ZZZZ